MVSEEGNSLELIIRWCSQLQLGPTRIKDRGGHWGSLVLDWLVSAGLCKAPPANSERVKYVIPSIMRRNR